MVACILRDWFLCTPNLATVSRKWTSVYFSVNRQFCREHWMQRCLLREWQPWSLCKKPMLQPCNTTQYFAPCCVGSPRLQCRFFPQWHCKQVISCVYDDVLNVIKIAFLARSGKMPTLKTCRKADFEHFQFCGFVWRWKSLPFALFHIDHGCCSASWSLCF